MKINDSILLLGSDRTFNHYVQLLIESEYPHQVECFNSKAELENYLDSYQSNESASLLIQTCPNIKYQQEGPWVKHIAHDKLNNDLSKLSSQLMSDFQRQKLDEVHNKRGDLLIRISTHQLRHYCQSNIDLYLKIGKNHFVQVSSKDGVNYKESIDNYEKKGNYFFYIQKMDFNEIIQYVFSLHHKSEASTKLKNSSDNNLTIDSLDMAFQISKDQLEALKISPFHTKFIHSTLNKAFEEIKSSPGLFQAIKKFKKQDEYLINHSILNMFFSTMLLSKVGWSNDQLTKQLIYASFFHDLSIESTDQAKVNNKQMMLNHPDRQLIQEHPDLAAQFVTKLPGVNNDAFKIINDHHERPDGSGFPRALNSSQIPPLSCLFILGHEIVDMLFESENATSNIVEKIASLEEIWNTGNFKRFYKCTKTIFF